MSSKRGRKCSIKSFDNFQHTHKHLSFFRFPKDIERCRTWIERTQRFDLLGKTNVHDERICQQHFEPIMFLNDSQNRLQQYAIPTLYLTSKSPPILMPSMDNLMINGFSGSEHAFDKAAFDMGMINAAAALLHQNNLTITPVYSSKSKSAEPMINKNQSLSEPLNLSSSSENGPSSPNDSIIMNNPFLPNDAIKMCLDVVQQQQKQQLQQQQQQYLQREQQQEQQQQLKHEHEQQQLLNMAKVNQQNTIPMNGTKPTIVTNNGGFKRPRQVFTMDQENQLADYVRDTSNYYSGLSSKEVRIMAFVYGVCNQVEMPPGWHESHQASFDWIVGFIKRTKLPPTMITGISSKGSSKQTKSSTNEQKSIRTVNQVNGHSASQNHSLMNVTPIEID